MEAENWGVVMQSKLSLSIKSGLALKGVNQASLAEAIDVSVNTVSNWTQSKNLPDRESLYSLKKYFSWPDEKLSAIIEDWYENGHGKKSYRIAGHDFVAEKYGKDYHKFLSYLIDLDMDTVGGLFGEHEGSSDQWAPIFETCTSTWKLLICGGEIVGYWHFICLQPKYFEMVLSGKIVDGEIQTDMIDYPVIPKHYLAYFTIITTRSADQGALAFNKLFKSLQSTIEEFAENGIFLSDVGATAFTHRGVRLCRDMGMKFLHRHPRASHNGIADIYRMSAMEMVKGYFGRNKRISKAYVSEFGKVRPT